jgi:hypothetical protein
VAELSDYIPVEGDFNVPSMIMMVRHLPGLKSDSALITIKSAKPYQFSEKQQKVLFSLPDMKGFDEVFELDKNCKLIEQ